MGKNNFIGFAIIIGLMLSISILLSPTVSAISVRVAYIEVHCSINISYIENNLCEDDNCSPKVSKDWDAYNNYGLYRFSVDEIRIFPDDGVIDIPHSPGWVYNFSDEVAEFLKEACQPDIAPVLNYLREYNLTEDYYNFYPYYPSGANITQVDDTWYFSSSSFDPEDIERWYREMEQFTFLVCVVAPILFVVTISVIIFLLIYKRWKKRNK